MIGSPDGFLFPPMLFPRNALASGSQAYFFPEKEMEKVKQVTQIRFLTALPGLNNLFIGCNSVSWKEKPEFRLQRNASLLNS
jgi:hypothetical protein